MGRIPRAMVAVGACVLVLPASASAVVVVRYDRDTGLSVRADPTGGDRIQVGFEQRPAGVFPSNFFPSEYVVKVPEARTTVVPGFGCVPAAVPLVPDVPASAGATCTVAGIRARAVNLAPNASETRFEGFGRGDTTVSSGAGADLISLNAGDNLIETRAGNDLIAGGGGSDVIRAGDGDDVLFATGLLEPGDGRDKVTAGITDDVIRARDGAPDVISCGAGNDRLDMDLADGKPPADCEEVDQGAIREGPNVRVVTSTATTGRSGSFTVALSCPRVVARCAGRLTVAGHNLGAVARAYSIRRGRRAAVRLRLGRSGRRALARRRRLTARLVSVETGVHGPKTTIRPLRLVRGRGASPNTTAASPRAAQAGEKSSTVTFLIGQGLRIQAYPGIKNKVVVQSLSSPARFRVQDDAAAIVADPGCFPVSVFIVECRTFGPRTVRAFLGDRDDEFSFKNDLAGGADAVIDGGESFDRLQGGDGYDVLIGGPDDGFDHLDGHAGNDVLLGGPGGDHLDGHAGNDVLLGGPGGDFLTGGSGSDRVFGESGGSGNGKDLEDNGEKLFLADGADDCYVATRIFFLEKDASDKEGCG
jgi:hypothetical protein